MWCFQASNGLEITGFTLPKQNKTMNTRLNNERLDKEKFPLRYARMTTASFEVDLDERAHFTDQIEGRTAPANQKAV